MRVVDRGSGRVVVLGHGIMSDHRVLTSQIDALAPQYRVLAVDFPGHGVSPAARGAWSMAVSRTISSGSWTSGVSTGRS